MQLRKKESPLFTNGSSKIPSIPPFSFGVRNRRGREEFRQRDSSGGGKWVCWWQTTDSGGPRWGEVRVLLFFLLKII
ncbi:hypothetical protein ES288_A03G077700v1 [Gossypium darwinii]|uniref:Uncharacterized protein n=1 Tax=Gossypium darwinii TaxID=34276 RepID=A0A5D2H278_GOSDA|nr:hypothetical protein ES288_A03G077700v1 [Gossypium darwinii]